MREDWTISFILIFKEPIKLKLMEPLLEVQKLSQSSSKDTIIESYLEVEFNFRAYIYPII